MLRALAPMFLALFTLSAQAADVPGWEKTRWGMSAAAAKAATGPAALDLNMIIEDLRLLLRVPTYKIGKCGFTIDFFFDSAKPEPGLLRVELVGGQMMLGGPPGPVGQDPQSCFDALAKRFAAKYGAPTKDWRGAGPVKDGPHLPEGAFDAKEWSLGPTTLTLVTTHFDNAQQQITAMVYRRTDPATP